MIEKLKHINWEDFHFLRSEYLWVGIPAIIIIVLGLLFYHQSYSWKKNISKHLRPYVIQKGTVWKSRLVHLSVLLMFVMGFVGFLGPSWSQIKLPAKKIESQFVIALDLSKSMLAEDITPSRLERAKFKIHDLLDANPRAETSLVVFAGSTHIAIPYTTDYKIITDQLDGLKPGMMPVQGTEFNVLFNKIDSLFTGNKAEGKLLLITDDLADLPIERFGAFLQQNHVQIYVYPFATQKGAEIPQTNQKSILENDKLQQIDAFEKAAVLNLTLDDSDVKDLAIAISDDIVFEDNSETEEENWKDQGYWLIFPLAVLFLFSFRKGWSLNIIAVMLILTSCSEKNKDQNKAFKFADLWYTQDYQGQKAYDTKNYLEAAQKFNDPIRKGVAYYKAGDYLSAQTALEKDTSVTGLYNLGLTYAKLGKLDQSQAVFEKVLQKDPGNTNANANLKQITSAIEELKAMTPEHADLNEDQQKAKNKRNDSMEDLSGGGQEATEEDMKKERREEVAQTGKRKAKELDDIPDDFESGKGQVPKNVLLRKVDDDPALFLTKKFRYQVKKKLVEVKTPTKKW